MKRHTDSSVKTTKPICRTGEDRNAYYRSLVEHSPDVLFSLDPMGRFEFVNMRVRDFLGHDPEDMIGKYLAEFVVHSDRNVTRSIQALGANEVWDKELDFLHSDGTCKHARVRIVRRVPTGGRSEGFDAVLRDRTRQHRLQKKLQEYRRRLTESEKRYRGLVETLPDVVFSLDGDGAFTYVNSQVKELLDYNGSDLLGKKLMSLVAPWCRDQVHALFSCVEGIWDEELACLSSTGECRWVRIRCRIVSDPDGAVRRFDGVMRDRTERRKLEDCLKASREELVEKMKIIDDLYEHIVQSEKARSIAQHTAETAHELRQPLTIIGGLVRRMAKKLEQCETLDLASQRDCLNVILKEIDRLEKILAGLVDFTRSRTLNPMPVDPTDVIEDVLHAYEALLMEKCIDCSVDFGTEVNEVNLDPVRFQHVIRNLISNAIEASPREGKIRIRTGVLLPSDKAQEIGGLTGEGYYEITVENTGAAIPPEVIEKIFDPFYTTKDCGTGIGLTLTKKIVEDHQGSISVSSTDERTRFSVWLPLGDHAGPPRDSQSEGRSGTQQSASPTELVCLSRVE